MQTYDCHVRLGNTTTSEVPKAGITASEIMVLRSIHGPDAVVRVSPAGALPESPATHNDERARLRGMYERGEHQKGMIARLFGPDHIMLPLTLNPVDEKAAAEAVAAKEASEAETKQAFEAEVARQVAAQVAAIVRDKADAEATKAINEVADAAPEAPVATPKRRGRPPKAVASAASAEA